MGSSGSKSQAGGDGAGWQPSQPGAPRRVSQSGHDITPLTVEERIAAAAPLSDFQRHVALQARRAAWGRPEATRTVRVPLAACLGGGAVQAATRVVNPRAHVPCREVCRPAPSAPSRGRRWTGRRTTTSGRASTCRRWAACPCSARVRAPPRRATPCMARSAWTSFGRSSARRARTADPRC